MNKRSKSLRELHENKRTWHFPSQDKMAAPFPDGEDASDLLRVLGINASGDVVAIGEMQWREPHLQRALSSVVREMHAFCSFSSRNSAFGKWQPPWETNGHHNPEKAISQHPLVGGSVSPDTGGSAFFSLFQSWHNINYTFNMIILGLKLYGRSSRTVSCFC